MQKIKFIQKILENKLYVYGLFLLLGFALYANTLKGPFLWDDVSLIVNNEYIRSFEYAPEWFTESALSGSGKTHSNLYRPFTTFINAIIYSLFGASAWAYRVLLIVFHTINSYLVFRLFTNLSFAKITAFFTGLVFLVHPVHSEAVAYIAGVPDVMVSFFILLGLALFSSENFTKNKVAALTLPVVFILALLSKEIGIILFPLVTLIGIYNWKSFSKKEKKVIGYTLATLAVIAAIYITLKMTVLNFTGRAGLTQVTNEYIENLHIRIITFLGIIWEYVRLMFFPKTLLFEKPTDFYTNILTPKVLFGITTVIAGLVYSVISLRKGERKFALGFFWFFLALAPVSGVIVANTAYAERWLYIPIVGILILLAHEYETREKKKKTDPKVIAVIATIIIIMLGARTIHRNSEWADPETFFTKEMSLNELSPRLHTQLGVFEFERRNFNRAIEQFEQSVAKDVDGVLYASRHNMGNAYFKINKYPDALYWYFDALYVHPKHVNALKQIKLIMQSGEIGNGDPVAIQNQVDELLTRISNGQEVTPDDILALENMFH